MKDHTNHWSDRQIRKSRWLALFGAVIAVAALWACGQPWVAISLSGAASCSNNEPSPVSILNRSGAYQTVLVPTVCANGWELQSAAKNKDASQALSRDFGARGNRMTTFPEAFGMPSLVIWLAIAGGLIALGALARNAIILGASLLPAMLAAQAMSPTTVNIVGNLASAQYAMQPGWTVLSVLLPIAFLIAGVGTYFVAKANLAARRAAAAEAGRKPIIGVVRDLSAVVTRMANQAQQAELNSKN